MDHQGKPYMFELGIADSEETHTMESNCPIWCSENPNDVQEEPMHP